MDRYERRALSRRKRAIRAYDDALGEDACRRSAARAAESRARRTADAAVLAKQFPATSPVESTLRQDAGVPQPHDRVGGGSRTRSHPVITARSDVILAKQFPAKNAIGSVSRDPARVPSGLRGNRRDGDRGRISQFVGWAKGSVRTRISCGKSPRG